MIFSKKSIFAFVSHSDSSSVIYSELDAKVKVPVFKGSFKDANFHPRKDIRRRRAWNNNLIF